MSDQKQTKKERYELKKQQKQEIVQKTQKKRKIKRFLFWGFAVSVVVLSLWGIGYWASNTSPKYENKTADEITQSDWVKGNPQATVTLLEYSDFQCPACGSYFPIVKQLLEDHPDDVRFVYRHFPLRSIHAKAQLAGQASEAAGLQDKFWEMHDILFERQSVWVNGDHEELFVSYAQELGLNVEQFKNDLESPDTKNKVDGDYLSAVGAKLNSTPSFFVNGRKITNPRTYEEFKILINEALKGA